MWCKACHMVRGGGGAACGAREACEGEGSLLIGGEGMLRVCCGWSHLSCHPPHTLYHLGLLLLLLLPPQAVYCSVACRDADIQHRCKQGCA